MIISNQNPYRSFGVERFRAGSFFATITGWSSVTSALSSFKIIGDLMFYQFYITGTSNSTSVIATMPFGINYENFQSPSVAAYDLQTRGSNNSGAYAAKYTQLSTTNNQLKFTIYNAVNATTAWTASGTKIVYGQFIIPIAK